MSVIQSVGRRAAGVLGRESWLVRHMRPGYESFLSWSSGGRGIPWSINGATYRIDPRYRGQLGKDYDAPVAAFLRERVKAGAVCFDVGANVGVYVLQFAYWSRPTGRVVAFEPNPIARTVLKRHIQLNKLGERARVVPAAVGPTPGQAILYAAGADGMSRLGQANPAIADRASPVTVPVLTIDGYCEATGLIPDWLFIDIEGFEIAALAGASETVRRRGKNLGIIVEMHPNVWSSAGTTRGLAESMLDDLGLNVVPLTGQLDPLSDYGIVYLSRK